MGIREWRIGAVVASAVLGLVGAPSVRAEGTPTDPGPVTTRVIAGRALETFELPSPLVDTSTVGGHLERDRTVPKVNVLLPAGYADDPDREWPVLWWLHGANGGTDGWVPGFVERNLSWIDAIVVMPDGGTFGMYTNWWNDGQRGGPAWATYHLDLLRRTIEDRYRILPERRWHAIGGISMGGQGSLRYAALMPGYFGSVLAMSAAMPDMQALETQFGVSLVGAANGGPRADYPVIWGGAGKPYAEGNSTFALAENLAHSRLYLATGSGLNCEGDPTLSPFNLLLDSVTEAFINLQRPKFAARARSFGADVVEAPACGVHTFGVWDRAMDQVRASGWDLFGAVPAAPDRWTYRTIQTTGSMWGMDYAFTTPPTDLVEFERMGALLVARGSGEVTLRGANGCSMRLTLPTVALLTPLCPGP